jgi:hypothetical protein
MHLHEEFDLIDHRVNNPTKIWNGLSRRLDGKVIAAALTPKKQESTWN